MSGKRRTNGPMLVLAVVALSTAFLLLHQALRPLPASVLTYTDRSSQYRDAPFSREESVGISVLTALQAAQGYPDGTFHPDRTINRAEFLKIVLKSSQRAKELPSRPDRCFPDVRRADWFSAFVCFAKKQDIVAGYPDGLFHPENTVTYVEALKMLAGIYAHPLTVAAQDEWFSPHVRAAKEHGVFLFPDLPLDAPLTRGQMARLASAFRAEHEGELAEYLRRERGEEEEVQEEGGTSSAQASSSMSSDVAVMQPPVTSHHLLLGEVSLPIAEGTFVNSQEDAVIRRVNLRLDGKVKSLKAVHFLDAEGNTLGMLHVDTNDTENRRNWLLDFDVSQAPHFSSEREATFFFSAELEKRGMGGVPGELLRVQRVSLTLQNLAESVSWEITPATQNFPTHQTIQARITSVRNAGDSQGTIGNGVQKNVAAFAFLGVSLPETTLFLEELLFQIRGQNVDTSQWRLERQGGPSIECFRADQEGTTVTCPIIAEEFGILHESPTVFILHADVKHTDDNASLQVILDAKGGVGENGALRWSDGTGHYNWVDLPTPLAAGTQWEVK
ncbi:S-layer homology domain-containing protein [Candidatus Peregrinibacteria bacterium]|nr:S-layer homology domain-containing protein [Candidatus Peregrinibacteria bacterium]